MTPDQIDGVTKARLLNNLSRVGTDEPPFATNEAYMAWVTESAGLAWFPVSAADSYAEQLAGRTVAEIEAELAEAVEAEQRRIAEAELAQAGQDAPAEAPTLEVVKAAARARINAHRAALENGTVVTPWGEVQCDADSRGKINGAVLMAMLAQMQGEPFAIDWTLADNTTAHLDAEGMIALGVTVGKHIAALHESARAKKAAVDACETVEDVATMMAGVI